METAFLTKFIIYADLLNSLNGQVYEILNAVNCYGSHKEFQHVLLACRRH